MELLIRLLVFSRSKIEDLRSITELGAFLTDCSRLYAQNKEFDRTEFACVFDSVFTFLAKTLGTDSFRQFSRAKEKYVGPMALSIYEALAGGLIHELLEHRSLPSKKGFEERQRELVEFIQGQKFVGSGVRASTRIPKTVEIGRQWARDGYTIN